MELLAASVDTNARREVVPVATTVTWPCVHPMVVDEDPEVWST